MKTALILSAAIALGGLTGAASAQSVAAQSVAAQSGSDTFTLHMMGDRSWLVDCAMSQDDGDRVTRRERGRGVNHFEEISLRDVVGGRCEYAAPDDGELWLTIDTRRTSFTCPFGAESDGFCQMRVAPGMQGAFNLRRRGDPASAVLAGS